MIEALYIAESGLNVRQKQLDSIAHNIANISTSGFKANQINFMTVVQENHNDAGEIVSSKGVGVSSLKTSLDMSLGKLESTGRALDIAINGDGLFEVNLADGSTAYTRGGRMQVDEQGYLSAENGERLAVGIQIAPDLAGLKLSEKGALTGILNGGESIELGQLTLVNFSNNDQLVAVGNNLYVAKEEMMNSMVYGTPGESGLGTTMQGIRELSNVSLNEEMMGMMLAQRSYQLNARIVQVSDQILETLNNLRR
jgi:flagellar basal-body rod protein FlgG